MAHHLTDAYTNLLYKKLKAAIVGVLYYLQQQEDENNSKQENDWVRSGREIIMRNRMMVQFRGLRR